MKNISHFSNRFRKPVVHSQQSNDKNQRDREYGTYKDEIDTQAPEIIDDRRLGGVSERRFADQCISWMTCFGAGFYYKFSYVTSASDDENLELLSHRIKVPGGQNLIGAVTVT